MIAYGHNILFVSDFSGEKISDAKQENILIQEGFGSHLQSGLSSKITFHNNQGRHITLSTDRVPARSKKDQIWSFEVKNVISFYWFGGQKIISYIPQKEFTERLLRYWTLHIVLPFFFTLEEKYDFLHAGAAEIEGGSLLFVAESFGGKSTLTDFFLKQGHTMVSDDKAATYIEGDRCFALPSYPYHRPYRKMEDIGLPVDNFSSCALPIYALYELERVWPKAKIKIKEIKGVEKFESLRYSSEINISFLKQMRFDYLVRAAKIVPLFQITVPHDLSRLHEVYAEIIKHAQKFADARKVTKHE